MRTHVLALLSAAALIAPAAAHAQNPLSSIFSCNNPNNRQQGGAITGALLGGLLGNQINDNDRTTGAIVGGLLGAAAGSAIGCNMNSNDTSRATDATRQALNENRSTSWRAGNGASGRIDIVDTWRMSDASSRGYDPYYDTRNGDRRNDDRYGYDRRANLDDLRFAYGVQRPIDYVATDDRFQARSLTNVRAAPGRRARVMTQLRAGEAFDAVARVNGNWLLAMRGDQAIGYVMEDVVARAPDRGRDNAYDNRNRGDRYSQGGQLCRSFDQTIDRPGYAATTQRFTACQTTAGEWVIQS